MKHPYTVLTVAEILSLCWLLTHEACAHPIGNSIAAIIGFIIVPFCLLALQEKGKHQ